MMQAAAYGRLGQDPKQINTQSGKPMAAASIAVSVGEQDEPPEWIGVVAFGRVADDLVRHQKGDLVSVSGRVQRSSWTGQDGQKRDQLQIVADALISARTARPGGGRKQQDQGARPAASQRDRQDDGGYRDMNDDLPF